MAKRVPVHYGPLTLELPEWMDTNETYYLTRPGFAPYPVRWDIITNSWQVQPF